MILQVMGLVNRAILCLKQIPEEPDLQKMLTFANAAASIITTRKGALKVMPTVEEIENLIKERN